MVFFRDCIHIFILRIINHHLLNSVKEEWSRTQKKWKQKILSAAKKSYTVTKVEICIDWVMVAYYDLSCNLLRLWATFFLHSNKRCIFKRDKALTNRKILLLEACIQFSPPFAHSQTIITIIVCYCCNYLKKNMCFYQSIYPYFFWLSSRHFHDPIHSI